MLQKLRKSVRKNLPEVSALFTGRMPSFIYGFKNFKDIPVFCFHSAGYPHFEDQLLFLKKNNYRTLTADEQLERLLDRNYRNDGKEIALTFDDGMASVWTVAFPLLQKYEYKIVSFILPGLIEEGESVGPTIDDVENAEKLTVVNRDYNSQPLCNWHEIKVMHESGLVDFQSHGMLHQLVSISPKIVDFISPEFDAHHYGNIHIPAYSDGSSDNLRVKVLGHPVYAHDTRFSGKRRYLDPFKIRQACAGFVEDNGGVLFFRNKGWRKEIGAFVEEQKRNAPEEVCYETEQEQNVLIEKELLDSKIQIESRLRKQVRHFCFPWFKASETSARLAGECGFESIHIGAVEVFRRRTGMHYPTCVKRLQEEYLYALPGMENKTVLNVWMGKLQGHAAH